MPTSPVIHPYSAGERGVYANAYLVEGDDAIVAVDSQFILPDIRALRRQLELLGKPLAAVLLTHAHPDHVNGAGELRGESDAPVVALPGVERTLREIDEPKRRDWTPVYGDDYPPDSFFPNRLIEDGESVELAGLVFTARDAGAGESASETVWMLDSDPPAAFVGDTAYNRVHAWLAEGRSGPWLEQIERVRSFLPSDACTVYPGHGTPAGDLALLDWQATYLSTYRRAVEDLAGGRSTLSEAEKRELEQRMEEFAPGAPLRALVSMSADAVATELAHD